ncbi:sulfite exporter TauE/SafE family protein [Ferviditalea candida]|uniref:Probable membrane transporter protein n=1 Tax=Ferviditalea candida TaxID=3108399 RepID=A0ABU5ZFV4_9BACL|nr:sulfite exporter TauE/SafE family protein [Paenibacillaceae bacterium T2]
MIDGWLILIIAFASAILNGLTSIGGGILFILILMYLGSAAFPFLSMQAITTITIFFSLSCAVSGSLYFIRRKLYDKNMNGYLGASCFAGGWLGSKLSDMLPAASLQLIFFVLSLIAALSVLLNSSGRMKLKSRISLYWLLPIGTVIGMLGGMYGIGLGFLLLPLMVAVYDIPIRHSIGSALFIAAAITVSALLGKIGDSVTDYELYLFAAIGGITGTWLGGMISVKTPTRYLQVIVALVILGTSLKFLIPLVIR